MTNVLPFYARVYHRLISHVCYLQAPPVYRSPSPGSRPDTPKIVVNNTDWEETPTKKTSKPLEF